MEKGKLTSIFLALLFIFGFFFLYTKFIGPIPFAVNNTNTNTTDVFQTQGTGKASAAPDTAVINLGITQSSANIAEAQRKTNEASLKIVNGLKSLGIPEKNIKTTNYSVDPNYSNFGQNQNITGYTVAQNFEVKTPIEKTNEAIDNATKNGANVVGNMSFTLSDQNQEKLTNEARTEAVNNAKKSAEGLSKASGIKLGKIINVTENSNPILIRPMNAMMDLKASGITTSESTPTTITPGQSNIEVSVTLTYQTL